MKARILPALGVAACLAGCGDANQSSVTATAHTYWGDVAPVLFDKCVKCHQPAGVGPFSMLSYEDVAPRALLIAARTQARQMPPYLITHDGSCGQFEDAEALSGSQIDLLAEFARGGMSVGSKATLALPRVPRLEGGTDLQTPPVVPTAAGGALAQFDDYRCFLVDAGLARDRFITGYEILPGKPEIVHHVLAFVVDPDRMTRGGKRNRELMQALDDKDPDRPGWECFGGAGEGIEEDASPVAWAPGQGPVTFPDGMGVRQRSSHKLVVQMHYNLADEKSRGLMDSTTVRIRYADSVQREMAFLLPDGFLQSLFTKMPPDSLRPGMPSEKYSWKFSMAELGLDQAPPLEVIAVAPHMHQRGRKSELRLITAGKDQCAARVEDWNFHWQKFYFYKGARPTLTPDSQIQLTCDYDTTGDHTPVLPGWGTRNEMCLNTLMVALPPAP
jgi:hypothetical protein